MPKPIVLEPGVQYILGKGENQVGYQVLEMLAQGEMLVQNITEQGGKKLVHRQDMLRCCLFEGTLRFVLPGKSNLRENVSTLRTADGRALKTSYDFSVLSDLPTKIQDITRQRFELVKRIFSLRPGERTKDNVEVEITTFLDELIKAKGRDGIPDLLGNHIGKGTGLRKKKDMQSSIIESTQTSAVKAYNIPTRTGKKKDRKPQKPFVLSISYRTVCRWMEDFEQSRCDVRSLVPEYHKNGPQRIYIHLEVQDVVKRAIKKVCEENHDPTPMISTICLEFKELLKEENAKRSPDKQLSAPSDRSIYRFIRSLDPEELAELGMRQKKRGPKNDGEDQPPKATRPNERWEFDFCRLDALIVDAFDRLPIGRPVLAAIRDKYTGYPVAIFISFEPPSYRLVMECLMYAILEKVHVKELFHTTNDYLAYGIPETLVVDNGLELHEDLEMACLQLGIELVHTEVRSPWLKGAIERWFRTVNQDLIHRIPGTTFSSFLERGDYASEKNACMTLDALWEALHIWIVDSYTQKPHTGIGPEWAGEGIPAQLWKDALEHDFVPALPPSRDELLVLVSRTTTRTPEPYGIDFENLVYQSPEMKALKARMEQPQAEKHMKWHGEPGKVQVTFYPGDLSRLWVLDPFDLHYFEVRAVSKEYTRGLSLWKHLVIKRFVRETMKRTIDEDALLEAKRRIQDLINEEFRQTQSIRSRLGAARWFDNQVVTWTSGFSSRKEDILPETFTEIGRTSSEKGADKLEDSPTALSDLVVNSTQTAEGISALSASHPPLMENVELVHVEDGQREMINPITELPPMPETPPQMSNKKRRPRKQEKASSSQTVSEAANAPQSFGISVSFDRPFIGDDL